MAAHSSPPMARAGEASATSVCGPTGQIARWPASGSRMMPDRKPDAAALGRPGPDADGHQPDRPPAQESLAGVVGQQLLADDLLRAVAGLRVGQGVVVHDRGQRVLAGRPEDGQGAREHHDRARPQRAARREQRLGGAQVGPHAEVEVRLAFRADRRGEVEDDVGPGERSAPAPPRRAGRRGRRGSRSPARRRPGPAAAGARSMSVTPRQRARRAACDRQRARAPAARRARRAPRNPAPPVTTTFATRSPACRPT